MPGQWNLNQIRLHLPSLQASVGLQHLLPALQHPLDMLMPPEQQVHPRFLGIRNRRLAKKKRFLSTTPLIHSSARRRLLPLEHKLLVLIPRATGVGILGSLISHSILSQHGRLRMKTKRRSTIRFLTSQNSVRGPPSIHHSLHICIHIRRITNP